jgi:type IV pilus assembly protein PilV
MRTTPASSSFCRSGRRPVRGFMILEVLIALLIFSLGVLGLVGLQANATKVSGQAQYRAQAVLLANELIGMMWAGDHTNANLTTVYGSGSTDAGFAAWQSKVTATLPSSGASAPSVTLTTVNPLTLAAGPAGSVVPLVPTPSTQVAITIYWHAAGEVSADTYHNVTVVTQIK